MPSITVSKHPTEHPVPVIFEYRGSGYLEIKGSVTGQRYVFTGKGAKQSIHSSDVSALMAEPLLERAGAGL